MGREQRKLTAILAADMVGYSRLMGRDEAGTLARLKTHRADHLEPALTRNGGRLVKLTGDGVLAEFASAVDAVRAAVEFQQAMAELNRNQPKDTQVAFRVGLNLGDVIVDGGDLYGDGVNVAARLESEAEAGGIVASGAIRDAVEGRLKASFRDLGSLALKNIERPVQAFRIEWEAAEWNALPASRPNTDAPLALPAKPSIAVLPFQNLSGDPEQEYFADGTVEDIITALSRINAFFVIARNSSFAYKGRALDVRQVGRELGVRYLLEGSVRRAGRRIRITSQLVDSTTGSHVWADRYDRDTEDIFAIQDEISRNVVASLEPHLYDAEASRAQARPENLDAWGCVIRALSLVFRIGREQNAAAQALARRAISFDPTYARAHSILAWATLWAGHCMWDQDPKSVNVRAAQHAEQAIALDPNEPWARVTLGHILSSDGKHQQAITELEAALGMNQNFALARSVYGWILLRAGRFDDAVSETRLALRLSPNDSFAAFYMSIHGLALLAARQFEDALPYIRRSASKFPEFMGNWRLLASCCGHLGLLDEAKMALERTESLAPGRTLASTRQQMQAHAHHEVFVEGLRLAGMPD